MKDTSLDGDLLTRLRPPLEGEQALLDAWRADPQSPYDDFTGPEPAGTEAQERLPLIGAGWLVVADGHDDPLGTVSWHAVHHGPTLGSIALDIGISLRPFARGLGHGVRAQRMLAQLLFATTPVHRVQASTDVTNLAEQRSLERAGFSREGVHRAAQWRQGQFHDLVVFSRLRTDA